jgi:regulator of RNase E activity RraA
MTTVQSLSIANPAKTTLKEATREKLSKVGSATVANMLLARGLRNVYLLGLNPLSAEQEHMVGPAYTLRFIPAREDIDNQSNYAQADNLHRRAIEECPPGCVLVLATGGCVRAAAAGDLMAARLHRRGVLGMVTDGGFRDGYAIQRVGIPAYQRQAAPPATSIALHPAELDGPVGCADVVIYPGDVLVGDKEGVAVIPAHIVDEIADEALEVVNYEKFADLHIARGRPIIGLFPPTPESLAEYRDWIAEGCPKLEAGHG